MRCFSCGVLSLSIICDVCQNRLFVPSPHKRKIGTLEVISFYNYDSLQPLLLTKHTPQGYRIYRFLSKITLIPFIKAFNKNRQEKSDIYIIGIDENIKSGYSHIALLTQKMKMPSLKILHSSLMARNTITYAGKNLQFRQDNPRNFVYTGKSHIDAILVDDIITTGITLTEAIDVLRENSVNVLFALTLADVQRY